MASLCCEIVSVFTPLRPAAKPAARPAPAPARRDDTVVGQAQWQLPIPADAGVHHITASAPGHQSWSSDVELKGAGATVEISVPDLELAPEAPTPVAAPVASSASSPVTSNPPPSGYAKLVRGATRARCRGGRDWPRWRRGGVDLRLESEVEARRREQPLQRRRVHRRHRRAAPKRLGFGGKRATVAFVVGAAGLVGGAILWFTASPSKHAEAASAAETQLGFGVGRVVVSGRF